jgi:uncharacterized protein (DUF362 family)
MKHPVVAIVRYEKPMESVRRAVDLSSGLKHLSPGSNVFIKPNIVFWTREVRFPKWGVITTSRVVEDIVILLKELGCDRITIGEGSVLTKPKDPETPAHAFETLGYNVLKKRYGIRCINFHERPYEKVDLGEGITLNFNSDILHSDFVVNIPVLKTHSQVVVTLGIKNLKGALDIRSRQICHSADPVKDLNYMIARLPKAFPPVFTIIDGIYTSERGPGFDARVRRSNLLVASSDLLSADMVGAKILGYEPSQVPHLVHAARERGRSTDLSDVKIVGEAVENVSSYHEYSFPYTGDGRLPVVLEKMGIRGLSYWKYDLTLCTYCSSLTRVILPAIARAWKGKPWDDVEVLTGKTMKPTKGKKKAILFGKCIYQANRDNPHISEMIAVKGCPPSSKQIVEAFHKAGIPVDPSSIEKMDRMPGSYMKKYEGRPEFEETHFTVS